MQTSIATVSISGTLVEKLTAIQTAGFDGVEIFENDLLYFDGSPADVRRSPLLGEHTDEVLGDVLRYSDREIADIKASGALSAADKKAEAA